MKYWFYFGTPDFALAASAFVLILLVVAVRGARDLRETFRALREAWAVNDHT